MRYIVMSIMTVALLILIAPSSALSTPITVATFADPGSGTSPLFTFVPAGGGAIAGSTLSGGWSGSGLTLEIPALGLTFANATFTITSMTANGTVDADGYQMDPTGTGTLAFFDSGAANVLNIAFDLAHLNNSGVGATDVLLDGVDITSPLLGSDIFLDPESFAFSFANANPPSTPISTAIAQGTTLTWSASFTSSAEVIPEPSTLLLFGTGLIVAGTFARKRLK